MPFENQYYSLVTLNDPLFAAGFAGMRASLLARTSPSSPEIKVVVASPSKVSHSAVIKFVAGQSGSTVRRFLAYPVFSGAAMS